MKEILFVYPPGGREREWEYSLGIAYIIAYLKKNYIKAEQYIPNRSVNVEQVVKELAERKPSILFFSCYDTNYYYIKLIIEGLVASGINAMIILGGPTATFSSHEIMNDCKYIDMCIIGEGEVTCLEIIKEYCNRKEWKYIDGIVYRNNGKIIQNKKRKREENIDYFPSPYLENTGIHYKGNILILTSRGCVFDCIYCNCTIMNDKTIRYHSIERVIEELAFIQDNVGEDAAVLIGDDAFTLNIKRAKLICKEIINRKIKLKLSCETRVEYVDDELLVLLKEAGFVKIDFGLESANIDTLKTIKKCIVKGKEEHLIEMKFLEKITEVIQKVKKLNMIPMVNIIVGLPGEGCSEIKKTLEFVENLGINNYSHNILRVYAGTELYNKIDEYEFKIENSPFFLPYIVNHSKKILEIDHMDNCISRFEETILRNKLKLIISGLYMEDDLAFILKYTGEKASWVYKQDIYINQDIFVVSIADEGEKEIAKKICESKIGTHKINFIKKDQLNFTVYNYLEKQNKFKIVKCMIEDSWPTVMDKNVLYIVDINSLHEMQSLFLPNTPNPFIRNNMLVKNACKFCSNQCKLDNHIRGFFGNDGNVDLCYLSKYKIKISEAENFIAKMQKKEYALRNCEDCSIKQICPKCLIPDPLSREEYCNIMHMFNFRFNNDDYLNEYANAYQISEREKTVLKNFLDSVKYPVEKLVINDVYLYINNNPNANIKVIKKFLYFVRTGVRKEE